MRRMDSAGISSNFSGTFWPRNAASMRNLEHMRLIIDKRTALTGVILLSRKQPDPPFRTVRRQGRVLKDIDKFIETGKICYISGKSANRDKEC